MSLLLKKERIKEVPFHGGRAVRFQLGQLLDEAGKEKFRFTRSMALVRARYRITLQYTNREDHTPYVFDVIRSEPGSPLDIRPDSEEARKVWLVTADPRRAELTQALEAIFEQDIESA